MLNIQKFSFNRFIENSYLIWDNTKEAVIIDPGCKDTNEVETLLNAIREHELRPISIWLTHGHFDHIYGVAELSKRLNINIFMNKKDMIILDNNAEFVKFFNMDAPNSQFSYLDVKDGDILSFGNNKFEVIETPGHTPGGICFYNREAKVLFTGDTLFAGSIGRTDNEWGDYDKLIVSIMDKLMAIDGDVEIFPGHGGKSDIAYERTHNPFLEPFNEKEELEFINQ